MKKAKKLLALILGVLMLMGCISVSAASSTLVVEEAPAKMVYENDFSGQTVDTEHIVLPAGGTTVQSNGTLTAAPAPIGHFATIYAAKEGIAEPVYFEFDISNTGLTDYSNAIIQLFFLGNNGSLVGDLRWNGGNSPFMRMVSPNTSVANHKDVTCNFSSISVKVKMNPVNDSYAVWVNGNEFLSEADGVKYAKTAFTVVEGLKINMANTEIRNITIDNVKIYTEQAADIPVLWEEVSREEFENDMTTAANHGNMTLLSTNVSHTWNNGMLSTTSTASGGAKAWEYTLKDDGSALTGEYIVETRLSRSSGTTNTHRLSFINGDTTLMYIGWSSKINAVNVRHWNPSVDSQVSLGTPANFNAADTLKVTAYFNTANKTVKIWLNDILAHEYTFDGVTTGASINKIAMSAFTGSISVDDIRVYRPVKGLMKAETDNAVKFATDSAKAGRLYFATYTGADETKSLANLGTAALNLAPGKVYTIDKSDWNGAKVFYWDNDQKPIIDPFELTAE